MKNYSQNDEQQVVIEYFKGRVGKFLDIGAYDGVTISNTRALAELGWKGVMVEPRPENLVNLIDSVKGFDGRIDVWSCAVSASGSPAILKMTSDTSRAWATTISNEMPDEYIPDPVGVRLYVPTVRISELLSHGPFDFINLDAEWMDFEILRDSPRFLGGCSLLCVEPRGLEERKEMIEYLDNHLGFVVHYETKENIIVRKNS